MLDIRQGGDEVLRVSVQRRFQGVDLRYQRHQRLRQRGAVPVPDLRLHLIAVTALTVAVIADMRRIILERPIVQRQAQNRHIVGIEHAMHEAHPLPLRNQARGAGDHFFQQRQIRIGRIQQGGVKPCQHIIGQDFQFGFAATVKPVLERTKAHKAGRNPRHHGGAFGTFAEDRIVRGAQRQCARGRNTQPGHRFRTQKFADRGAQHRAPVAHA